MEEISPHLENSVFAHLKVGVLFKIWKLNLIWTLKGMWLFKKWRKDQSGWITSLR